MSPFENHAKRETVRIKLNRSEKNCQYLEESNVVSLFSMNSICVTLCMPLRVFESDTQFLEERPAVQDRRAAGGSGRGRGPRRCRPPPGRRHDGQSAKFRQNVARFRLYRLRFLQENMRFAAFFKIYQIHKLKFLKFCKFIKFNFATFAKFC